MKRILLACLVLAAAPAGVVAQPKGGSMTKTLSPEQYVEQSVRRAIEAKGNWNGRATNLAPDAIVVDRDGKVLSDGDIGHNWYGGDLATGDEDPGIDPPFTAKTTVGKLDIWADATKGIGWFRGTLTVTVTNQQTSEDLKPFVLPISGISVQSGGWKVAALVLTQPLADKKLIDGAAKGTLVPATGEPKTSGDAALAKAAGEWFASGFTGKSVVGAKLAATGTAPGEAQTGAGVAKLVKAWDGLKLKASSIDARTYAKGTIGFVRAEVTMPLKKGGKAAPLVLGAIALNDGSSWKWVSLQFATPVGIPHHGPPTK